MVGSLNFNPYSDATILFRRCSFISLLWRFLWILVSFFFPKVADKRIVCPCDRYNGYFNEHMKFIMSLDRKNGTWINYIIDSDLDDVKLQTSESTSSSCLHIDDIFFKKNTSAFSEIVLFVTFCLSIIKLAILCFVFCLGRNCPVQGIQKIADRVMVRMHALHNNNLWIFINYSRILVDHNPSLVACWPEHRTT